MSPCRTRGAKPRRQIYDGEFYGGEPYGNESMLAAAILAYIVLCMLTGFCGTHRRMGFWGTFFLALLTTPLVVLPVLFITGPSRRFE